MRGVWRAAGEDRTRMEGMVWCFVAVKLAEELFVSFKHTFPWWSAFPKGVFITTVKYWQYYLLSNDSLRVDEFPHHIGFS